MTSRYVYVVTTYKEGYGDIICKVFSHRFAAQQYHVVSGGSGDVIRMPVYTLKDSTDL